MSKRLDPSALAGAFARRSQRPQLDFLVPAKAPGAEPPAEAKPRATSHQAKPKPKRKVTAARKTKPVRKARVSRKKSSKKKAAPGAAVTPTAETPTPTAEAATPVAPTSVASTAVAPTAVAPTAVAPTPVAQTFASSIPLSTEADIRVPSWSPASPYPRPWSWRMRASRRLEGLVARVLTRVLG